MDVIYDIAQIKTKLMPEKVKADALNFILESFVSEEDAVAFWCEFGCFLILIEEEDSDDELELFDQSNHSKLDFISCYPEHTVFIGENNSHVMALSIINDSGSGAYLLAPVNHSSRFITALNFK
jgi:hypothetical protein